MLSTSKAFLMGGSRRRRRLRGRTARQRPRDAAAAVAATASRCGCLCEGRNGVDAHTRSKFAPPVSTDHEQHGHRSLWR